MTSVELRPTGPEAAVDLRPGDELVLRLPESPTGHRWRVETVDGPVHETGSTLEPATGVRAAGAAAERRITVRADADGEAVVTVGLRRAWEDSSARRIAVRVTVRSA